MTPENQSTENFGCKRCWPAGAEAAWEERRGHSNVTDLIDESHLHIMILECSTCSQRFVSVFTEMIDWVDGDDSQYWILLPLTPAEGTSLIDQRASLTQSTFATLGPDRRCLRRDHPKGEKPAVYWGRGLFVGPHD